MKHVFSHQIVQETVILRVRNPCTDEVINVCRSFLAILNPKQHMSMWIATLLVLNRDQISDTLAENPLATVLGASDHIHKFFEFELKDPHHQIGSRCWVSTNLLARLLIVLPALVSRDCDEEGW